METKELKHYKHYFGSRLSEVKKMILAILRVILNFFSQPCLVRLRVRVQNSKSVPKAPINKYVTLGLW